jgi:hypothetical protein
MMPEKTARYLVSRSGALLTLLALTFGCAHFKNGNNSFFSEAETTLLKATVDSIDYAYGYDTDIRMNHIYDFAYSRKNLSEKEKAFAKIISSTDLEKVESFYFKLLRLSAQGEYLMGWYEQRKNWSRYTYIKNYIAPPLQSYMDLLKKQILVRDPSFADKEKVQIDRAKKWASWYMRYEYEVIDTF